MKIGIFDPYLDTLSGGEKYMLSIALCLSSEHEVFIFWDKEKEAEIIKEANRKLGINLQSVRFYKNIFAKNISFLSRFIESRKFDAIIYLSDGSIPFVGTKLYIHFQFPIEWVNMKSFKVQFKLSFIKKIFCNSNFTKHLVDKKLNVNSSVLYPPVNIHDLNIKKENIILHVGRFDMDKKKESNYKKQDVMVSVFKRMIDQGLKDWKFIIIVGVKNEDKNKLNKLKIMAKSYPIGIIENPSNEVLWEYYLKAKIYWHASGYGENLDKNPELAEHFGISTVEAMGSGAVAVVINAGGQKEIVENNKSGFLWNSLEELMKKTVNLIKDPKLLEKMSKEAIKRSGIFSGSRFCNELIDIIQ